jgi:hypothetical protein
MRFNAIKFAQQKEWLFTELLRLRIGVPRWIPLKSLRVFADVPPINPARHRTEHAGIPMKEAITRHRASSTELPLVLLHQN